MSVSDAGPEENWLTVLSYPKEDASPCVAFFFDSSE